jgi:nucleotide-binding universal stress UspA family protein
METILTVVDLKSGTAKLVAETCKYAKALHANVILVNIEPLLPGAEGTDKNDVTRDLEDGYGDEIQTILGLGEELTAQGITHRELIIEGTAAEQLLLAAEREAASLVIIGSYPHGALVEALTHGLREQLAKKAPCPVLLVPVR